MKTSTISIGIPSYNEAHTITTLLDSIQGQMLPKQMAIKEIIVSDCSTDKTPFIVNSYKYRLPIKLFHHTSRMGLNYAANEIFKNASSDFIVYVNADTKLHPKFVAKLTLPLIRWPKVGLASATMIPLMKPRNIVQKGSSFGAFLLSDIRKELGKLVFHGRAFAIRANFAKKTELLQGILDQDTFLCYACFDAGLACLYIDDAICYYMPPSSLRDFVLPNRLYSAGLRQLFKYRPEWFRKYALTQLFGKDVLRVFLRALLHDPVGGLTWAGLKLAERFYPLENSAVAVFKPQAASTKVFSAGC